MKQAVSQFVQQLVALISVRSENDIKKNKLPEKSDHHLVVFKSKQIRRTLHNNEWWFVINDIVEALTDTVNPSDYIKKMRIRDEELSKGWGQIITPLSVETSGGMQKLNCANTEGIFRIIQG